MIGRENLLEKIKNVSKKDFESISLEVFDYQYQLNSLYKEFCNCIKGEGFRPKSINEIPFLPVSFFKTHKIVSGNFDVNQIYKSSATTGSIQSKHYVYDNQLYLENALKTFEYYYGSVNDCIVLALLPGYIERGDSSLISMAKYFIDASARKESGFFLNEFEELLHIIKKNPSSKIVLLGVSFALQQLAELSPDLNNVIVMETGGMKGKGKKMPKKAFHVSLQNAFNVKEIHSEYGMTELLSQAYSLKDGIFKAAPTMKVICKDITDPFKTMDDQKSGVINVIDLINIDSCSFIETQDLGFTYANGDFELLGRVDAAEIRGCNLLISDI